MVIRVKTRNRKIVGEFLTELERRGLKPRTILKYRKTLSKFGHLDYFRLNKKDCDMVFFALKDNIGITSETKHDYWLRFRAFAKWHRPKIELNGYKLYYKKKRKLPEEMLSIDEVRKIMLTANSLRDRAMISLLYDSGCRPHELLGLRAGDVVFDESGMVVRFDGKTGMRRIRIITTMDSANYMSEYMRSIRDVTKTIFRFKTVENMNKRIKGYAITTGISKRVYSYILRHSRATHLIKYKMLTKEQVHIYMGWDMGSKMPATYIHLAGADIDESVIVANRTAIPTQSADISISREEWEEFQRFKSRQPQNYVYKCRSPIR